MRDKRLHTVLIVTSFFALLTSTTFATETNVLGRIQVMADASSSDTAKKKASSPSTKSKRPAESRSKPGMPTGAELEVEKEVLQMVKQHMPKIDQMLSRLRESNPSDYQRAIRDLAKSARKLELAKKRDEALFDIELEILKARSDVNLLTAKLKVRDGASDRNALRKATEQLQLAEITRDEYELKALQERLAATERFIGTLQDRIASKKRDSKVLIEKSYIAYLRKAGHQPNEVSRKPNEASRKNDTPRKKTDAKK